jgi:hypothetical protein
MKNQLFLYFIVLLFFTSCQTKKLLSHCYTDYSLKLIEESSSPLLDKRHPASAGNIKGYEGGTVFLLEDTLRMFVTEEVNGWVGTRTGYWISKDGINWQRKATIMESVNKPDDPRNALWSPMPFFNENEARWNLFYVGYERDGVTNGRIFRAISSQKGKDGLAGPYIDVPGTVLSYTDKNRDPWEGSQGAAAFYVYRVGSKWYGFYASGDSKTRWDEGLATADSLEGKWQRDESPNPTLTYSENPIVSKLEDGSFFCIFDDIAHGEASSTIGYGYSIDGVNWKQKYFKIPMPKWAVNIRTPQGIIPVENDYYWIYFTAQTPSGFDCVGRMKVKLEKRIISTTK